MKVARMKPRALAIKMPRAEKRFLAHWEALGRTMWRTHLHTKRRCRFIEAIMR